MGSQSLKERSLKTLNSSKVIQLLLFAGLRERQQQEMENLTLTTEPFKVLKLFILAVVQHVKQSVAYLLAKGGWVMLLSVVAMALGFVLMAIDGPHEKVFIFRLVLSRSLIGNMLNSGKQTEKYVFQNSKQLVIMLKGSSHHYCVNKFNHLFYTFVLTGLMMSFKELF